MIHFGSKIIKIYQLQATKPSFTCFKVQQNPDIDLDHETFTLICFSQLRKNVEFAIRMIKIDPFVAEMSCYLFLTAMDCCKIES